MAALILAWQRRFLDRIGSLSIRTKIAMGVLLLLFGFGGVVIFGVRARMVTAIWEEHREQAILTAGNIEGYTVSISKARGQRAVDDMTRFLLLLTGGTALLGALGAYLLTSLIVNPAVQLTAVCDAIRSGDLRQRVPFRGSDEVARLAASFNVMADALTSSRNEIEDANRQLGRRNRGLAVLNAVAQAVSLSLDLEEILNGALEEVRVLLNVKVGWILLKEDGGRLKLAAARGFSEATPPDEIESVPETCACRQTLAGGQARVVDGSPVCLRRGFDVLRREGLDCHASVPLKTKEKVLGIMNLAYPADRHLAEDDVRVLNSVGQQIGMAIENARLYEDLRRKEARIIFAHEEERTRVARELHDEAGQSLTALLLQLGNLEEILPPGADQAKRRLAELVAFAGSIIQGLRRLMMDLRPALLDDLGLIPAIRSFAERQLERAGVRIEIVAKGGKRRLAPAVEVALFRILQEAIANIAKHARATMGTIDLCFKQSSVAICIADNGCGFDPVTSRTAWQTFGLLGIEERVALLGGTLSIDSQENRGTRIALEIPTPSAKDLRNGQNSHSAS